MFKKIIAGLLLISALSAFTINIIVENKEYDVPVVIQTISTNTILSNRILRSTEFTYPTNFTFNFSNTLNTAQTNELHLVLSNHTINLDITNELIDTITLNTALSTNEINNNLLALSNFVTNQTNVINTKINSLSNYTFLNITNLYTNIVLSTNGLTNVGLIYVDCADANLPNSNFGLVPVDGYTNMIDGVTRVLVFKRTTPSQNGIWIARTGSWTRASDADTVEKVIGKEVFIKSGGVYKGLRANNYNGYDTNLVIDANHLYTIDVWTMRGGTAGAGIAVDPNGKIALNFNYSNFLQSNGSVAMGSNLNMGGFEITNIAIPTTSNSSARLWEVWQSTNSLNSNVIAMSNIQTNINSLSNYTVSIASSLSVVSNNEIASSNLALAASNTASSGISYTTAISNNVNVASNLALAASNTASSALSVGTAASNLALAASNTAFSLITPISNIQTNLNSVAATASNNNSSTAQYTTNVSNTLQGRINTVSSDATNYTVSATNTIQGNINSIATAGTNYTISATNSLASIVSSISNVQTNLNNGLNGLTNYVNSSTNTLQGNINSVSTTASNNNSTTAQYATNVSNTLQSRVDASSNYSTSINSTTATYATNVSNTLQGRINGVSNYSSNINSVLSNYLMTNYKVTKDFTGFQNPNDVVVTYNSTSRKITLSNQGEAYFQGVKLSSITNSWTNNWTSDEHIATNVPMYLYFDGSNFVWSNVVWTFDMMQIAAVLFDTNGNYSMTLKETHGFMPWQSHELAHNTVGTVLLSGADIGGYVTNSSTNDSERRVSVSLATILDEDQKTILAPIADNTSYTVYYISNANISIYSNNYPEICLTTFSGQDTNLLYSANGILTPFPNSPTPSYGAIFVLALPVANDAVGTNSISRRFLFIMPQQISTSLATIQALSPSSVSLDGLNAIAAEFIFVGKIIVSVENPPGNGQDLDWKITSVEKLTGSKIAFSSSGGSGSSSYLSTVAVDGVTITGDGTVGNPLTASATGSDTALSNQVNGGTAYSNIIIIPPVSPYLHISNNNVGIAYGQVKFSNNIVSYRNATNTGNDTLEFYFRQFGGIMNIYSNDLTLEVALLGYVAYTIKLSNYLTNTSVSGWIKVSIPMTAFTTLNNWSEFNKFAITMGDKGGCEDIGTFGFSDIRCIGGTTPFIIYSANSNYLSWESESTGLRFLGYSNSIAGYSITNIITNYDFNGRMITNLAEPLFSNSAATKNYVENYVGSKVSSNTVLSYLVFDTNTTTVSSSSYTLITGMTWTNTVTGKYSVVFSSDMSEIQDISNYYGVFTNGGLVPDSERRSRFFPTSSDYHTTYTHTLVQLNSNDIVTIQIKTLPSAQTLTFQKRSMLMSRLDGNYLLTPDAGLSNMVVSQTNVLNTKIDSASNYSFVNITNLYSNDLLYLKTNGVVAMASNLNMGGNQISNIALTPTSSNMVASKNYVDSTTNITNYTVFFESDFLDSSTSAVPGMLGNLAGSATATAGLSDSSHPGVANLNPNTAAASHYRYASIPNQYLISGGEVSDFIFQIRASSAIRSNQVSVRLGFFDNTTVSTTLPVDSLCFLITNQQATSNLVLIASMTSNSVLSNSTNAPLVLNTNNQWYYAKIVVADDALSATFTVYDGTNGVQLWTATIGSETIPLPRQTGRDTGWGVIAGNITVTATALAPLISMDYMRLYSKKYIRRPGEKLVR
jgi:hypothetical protein